MSDPTEAVRREMVEEINTDPSSREWLEDRYGKVWDTAQLQEEFNVTGFLAPFVAASSKLTGTKGTLEFQHSPRYYYSFSPE